MDVMIFRSIGITSKESFDIASTITIAIKMPTNIGKSFFIFSFIKTTFYSTLKIPIYRSVCLHTITRK